MKEGLFGSSFEKVVLWSWVSSCPVLPDSWPKMWPLGTMDSHQYHPTFAMQCSPEFSQCGYQALEPAKVWAKWTSFCFISSSSLVFHDGNTKLPDTPAREQFDVISHIQERCQSRTMKQLVMLFLMPCQNRKESSTQKSQHVFICCGSMMCWALCYKLSTHLFIWQAWLCCWQLIGIVSHSSQDKKLRTWARK